MRQTVTVNYVLKPYQETTVDYLTLNEYAISGLQQGLGKSLCSLAVVNNMNLKALILCPAYLRYKWGKEVSKFLPHRRYDIIDSKKKIFTPWDCDIVIISYEALENAEVLFEWADIVISDEAHFLKNMDTKRTQYFHKLVYENSVPRLHLLTGTPVPNRTHEFYSLITLCNYNPRIPFSPFLKEFPTFVDFAQRYSFFKEIKLDRPSKKGGFKRVKVKKWYGARNVEELKRRLKNIYIRYTTEELDLPPSQDIFVPVEYRNDPALQEIFDTFAASGVEEFSVSGIDPRAKIDSAMAKVPFTVQYVESLLEEGLSVVVYTDHVEPCEALAKALGVRPIHGQTPMKVRTDLADAFQRGESKVIVATVKSFNTGIDLFAACDMVFNDVIFELGELEQALFRIKRIGQTKTCRYHYITGSYQDEKIWGILKEKLETIKEVV